MRALALSRIPSLLGEASFPRYSAQEASERGTVFRNVPSTQNSKKQWKREDVCYRS